MGGKMIILFAMALLLLIFGMTVETKTRPKLAVKKKTITIGQTYKLKLKGLPDKAKVKWKTSKKRSFPLLRKKETSLPL